MNKLKMVLAVLAVLVGGQLFAEGIEFKHISFEQALEEAQRENKLIFIDFYTVWCGPCKAMSNGVFPNEKVGALYNREFVNIKLDAEKEGREAARKYGVTAYPTTVFVNSNGDLVYKKVGAKDINQVIQMGKEALNVVNSGYSIADLKSAYASKTNDERFLRMYIDKMIEYREDPSDAIEAWLAIQTEIEEDDVDMMEFLFNHRKYLLVDGKAEEILKANYNEYWDIATRAEEKTLANMQTTLVYNTKQAAYQGRNPELMRAFITNWKQLEGNADKVDELKRYELNYCFLNNDAAGYKLLATAYLDSMIAAKSLEQIRAEDQAAYEKYKTNSYAPSVMGNAKLDQLAEGKEATAQRNAIINIGYKYLKFSDNKKDYKQLWAWIEYGEQLTPDNYAIDSFRADVLYKKGDTKEAITSKEAALAKLSDTAKERSAVERSLAKMQKGE